MISRTNFLQLARIYEKLEQISSGNSLRIVLSDFFKSIPKSEVHFVAYLTLGKIAPDYVDINLGMADKMVLRALCTATNKSFNAIVKEYKNSGDVGFVAEKFVGVQKRQLLVKEVFDYLHAIAKLQGTGSQEKKKLILAKLFVAASPIEARYLARIVVGQLRLGVGDKTIIDSLAIAFAGGKSAKKILERAYATCPDIGLIAQAIVYSGLNSVAHINIKVGRPVQMMLAQRVDSIAVIADKMHGLIAAEEKYDGERIQVHANNGRIILYSRRLENITNQFPDVIAALKKNVCAKKYVLEGEVVPVDKKGNLLPFQTLMARRRKYDIKTYVSKVPVYFYVFDLLLLNNKSFLDVPYPKRRAALESITLDGPLVFLAKRIVSEDLDNIKMFFNNVLKRGCEGIVAKSCADDSFYTPGARGWLWIKWKREYQKELVDTFDLVVVGAFAGKGRRQGTYGALLCAVYNSDNDVFETFCKLGTGFSDKDLKELPKLFPAVHQKPKNIIVADNMIPDFWIEPKIVVEVIGAEITKSPSHTAANGYALRFPRFMHYRKDKSPKQATTTKEILQITRK